MASITPNQFKRGGKIEIDGEPYAIVEYQHIKTGRGGATVRTKVKHLLSGSVLEKSFRSEEKIPVPDFESKAMQYLYNEVDTFFFMDNDTYEQIEMDKIAVGEQNVKFMSENLEVQVMVYKGNPVGVDLPNFVELEITQTDPGLRGDTVSGGSKPATVSTGGIINVPLFLNEGDWVKIDTRDGTYLERVRSAGK